MDEYIERVVDLTDPGENRIYNMSSEDARKRILSGNPKEVRDIDGSFAFLTKVGKTVRMARSMDRPIRYFLAKRQEGPALIVAERMDKIASWLHQEGFGDQFHPSYTRMVPAHYLIEIQLIGCPDPDPVYTRFFNPTRNSQPESLEEIGTNYIEALCCEISKWLRFIPKNEPVGVCFSGGIDSGAVFLATYHVMKSMGMNLSRLKAFTLNLGNGPDSAQAFDFLKSLNLELFLEPIEASLDSVDVDQTIKVVEDYKPLDLESAGMAMALLKAIRDRYPDWRYLIDGDGGDENLKDYPIEENPELTIRSVLNNQMLYQEGWGVGKIKHSLTYSGGQSRSYTRTYAPLKHFGFSGLSPFTSPNVVEIAEGIPYIKLTNYEIDKLYALKGQIVSKGIRSITDFEMPVFPKRRFQHGAVSSESLRTKLPADESFYRNKFLAMYA